jgi:GTP cyclohydrolase II
VSIRNRVQFSIGKDSRQQIEFVTFNDLIDKKEHIALISKNADKEPNPIVRIHSECFTGDVLFSSRCDCGEQLQQALEMIESYGGIILYLRQEGRGIGLYNKIDAYELQLNGVDTYRANEQLGFGKDLRSFYVAYQMLEALGINSVRLLTNNPEKISQLESHGIKVTEQIKTKIFSKDGNKDYLKAKKIIGGHSLDIM